MRTRCYLSRALARAEKPSAKRVLFLFLLSLLIAFPATAKAQREERVFEQYLQYLMQQEGYNLTDAIKEVQSLQQGRESLIQSYIKTEQDVQNLQQPFFNTQQSESSNYEKLYSEAEGVLGARDEGFGRIARRVELPTSQGRSLKKETEDEIDQFSFSFEDYNEQEINKEPMPTFIINDVREFTAEGFAHDNTAKEGHTFLEVGLENLGDVVDAIVAITSKDGVIIAKPYFELLNNFGSKTTLTFMLLEKTDELTVKIDAGKTSFKIPVSLHASPSKDNILPTMNVQPFSQKARVGSSAEYFITLEGDASLIKRYQLQTLHLPKGILDTFLISENLIPVSEVKFSASKQIINLVLRLTLSPNLEPKLIGKAIPFLVALSCLRAGTNRQASELVEQLTITPLGLGKITISAPLEEMLLPLDKKNTISITVENIGTADIPELELFADDTILGVEATCSPEVIALKKGEAKEIAITISATSSGRIGTHFIKIAALAKGEQALSEEITLEVRVKERKRAFFLSTTLFKPSLFLFCLMALIGLAYIAYLFGRKARKSEEFDEEVIEEEYA